MLELLSSFQSLSRASLRTFCGNDLTAFVVAHLEERTVDKRGCELLHELRKLWRRGTIRAKNRILKSKLLRISLEMFAKFAKKFDESLLKFYEWSGAKD